MLSQFSTINLYKIPCVLDNPIFNQIHNVYVPILLQILKYFIIIKIFKCLIKKRKDKKLHNKFVINDFFLQKHKIDNAF